MVPWDGELDVEEGEDGSLWRRPRQATMDQEGWEEKEEEERERKRGTG